MSYRKYDIAMIRIEGANKYGAPVRFISAQQCTAIVGTFILTTALNKYIYASQLLRQPQVGVHSFRARHYRNAPGRLERCCY